MSLKSLFWRKKKFNQKFSFSFVNLEFDDPFEPCNFSLISLWVEKTKTSALARENTVDSARKKNADDFSTISGGEKPGRQQTSLRRQPRVV